MKMTAYLYTPLVWDTKTKLEGLHNLVFDGDVFRVAPEEHHIFNVPEHLLRHGLAGHDDSSNIIASLLLKVFIITKFLIFLLIKSVTSSL